jgi:hypothetical protein
MSKHEFYADPTVFDHWQSHAGGWLCTQGEKVWPYGWALAFSVLGAVLVGVSVTLLGMSVHDTLARQELFWNQWMAQGITAVAALAGAQMLFRLARNAWPGLAGAPRPVRRAARFVGWHPEARAARKSRPAPAGSEHEAVQAFFGDVRDAGVNVSIARALFAAGIRSPQQLKHASDGQLETIRGVGPATVRKLRARFGTAA